MKRLWPPITLKNTTLKKPYPQNQPKHDCMTGLLHQATGIDLQSQKALYKELETINTESDTIHKPAAEDGLGEMMQLQKAVLLPTTTPPYPPH